MRSLTKRAYQSMAGICALGIAFHFAAYNHKEKTDIDYMDELPWHTAVVTGKADRISHGLEQLENREIGYLHISGVSSPVDSILFYNERDPAQFRFKQRISTDEAKNTKDNARHITAWARAKHKNKIGIITSNLHMHRLKYHLEKAAKGTGIEFSYHSVKSPPPSIKEVYWEYAALLISKADYANYEFQDWLWSSIKNRLQPDPSKTSHQPEPF